MKRGTSASGSPILYQSAHLVSCLLIHCMPPADARRTRWTVCFWALQALHPGPHQCPAPSPSAAADPQLALCRIPATASQAQDVAPALQLSRSAPPASPFLQHSLPAGAAAAAAAPVETPAAASSEGWQQQSLGASGVSSAGKTNTSASGWNQTPGSGLLHPGASTDSFHFHCHTYQMQM